MAQTESRACLNEGLLHLRTELQQWSYSICCNTPRCNQSRNMRLAMYHPESLPALTPKVAICFSFLKLAIPAVADTV